jgi:hypothetical protein
MGCPLCGSVNYATEPHGTWTRNVCYSCKTEWVERFDGTTEGFDLTITKHLRGKEEA